jgi:hypothetical protein
MEYQDKYIDKLEKEIDRLKCRIAYMNKKLKLQCCQGMAIALKNKFVSLGDFTDELVSNSTVNIYNYCSAPNQSQFGMLINHCPFCGTKIVITGYEGSS